MPRKRVAGSVGTIPLATEDGRPLIEKQLVQKWVEPQAGAAPVALRAAPESPQNAGEATDEEFEELSKIDACIVELGEFNSWSIRVERLPNYRDDGKLGQKAVRSWCADIAASPGYRDTVRDTFGWGEYWLTLYDDERRVVTREALLIRAPISNAAVSASTAIAVAQSPVQQSPQTIRDMLPELKAFAQMKTIMEQLSPAPSENNDDVDAILGKWLVRNPDIIRDRMQRLANPAASSIETEPAPWWIALVQQAAPTLMSVAETLANAYAQNVAASAGAAQESHLRSELPLRPVASQNMENEMPVDPSIPKTMEEMQEFFLTCFGEGVDPKECADVLKKFIGAKPYYKIVYAPYLSQSPESVVKRIVASCGWDDAPEGGVEWIQKLQAAMHA